MKCDELEEEYLWTNNVKTPSTRMVRAYNADDVDKAIAELKARIQLDDDEMAGFLDLEEECGGGDLRNYIAELKQKLEDVKASHYAEMVDAGMRERRLCRALYKVCANWADVVAFEETEGIGYDNSVAERWRKMERKCLKKAEEYK